ncbi:hypothetical protein Dda_2690 [Drechslerella dactyloides]|uniref:Phytoene synthase n=1 Tax=Drechslerella dactyloides TaxID=74499 RepID=A0AAD6J0G8_DREDA|nr:hypothetical protein Dda_2690 [Drechslerella dactyloides]
MSTPRALRRLRPALQGSTRRHSTAAAVSTADARAYCLNLLKSHDHPSFILSAFVPFPARNAHLAIRAFNIDLARIADAVSNPTVGRMRMQFFRDAIENTFAGRPPQEPTALLLARVLHADALPLTKSFFLKLIAAREGYLSNRPYASLDALESYAESTYSSLQYLSLESLGFRSANLDHVASHIGKAAGIAAVLRGTPVLAAPPGGVNSTQAAVLLPVDVCAEHGLRQEDVIRYGGTAEGLKDVVFAVATRASDHLITAREMLKHAGDEGKGRAFTTFLPAVPTSLYLSRLEKVDFDVFHASLQRREWRLPWKAYIANIRRQF